MKMENMLDVKQLCVILHKGVHQRYEVQNHFSGDKNKLICEGPKRHSA